MSEKRDIHHSNNPLCDLCASAVQIFISLMSQLL